MILYRFVDISTNFEGFLKYDRKAEILPTYPHTKNPQAVDKPVDNLGTHTNQLSICCLFR